MPLFAIVEANGPAWDATRGRREQRGWDEHARFMDGLASDGVIVLGGPLAGGDRVVLVGRAASVAELRERLSHDPWLRDGVLALASVDEWTLWLGELPPA